MTGPMTTWIVEKSNMVLVPESFTVLNLDELRDKLQEYADSYWPTPDKPPLGKLSFQYELDDLNRIIVVHSYFRNRQDQKARFVKLRRAHA